MWSVHALSTVHDKQLGCPVSPHAVHDGVQNLGGGVRSGIAVKSPDAGAAFARGAVSEDDAGQVDFVFIHICKAVHGNITFSQRACVNSSSKKSSRKPRALLVASRWQVFPCVSRRILSCNVLGENTRINGASRARDVKF